MDILRVEKLSFAYPQRSPVLRELDFSIRAGEHVVLAGLSGSGKSTLAQILCGVIPQLIPGELSGSIYFNGQEIIGRSPAQLAQSVGLVFQDSDEQLICTTVEDELAFGPENMGLSSQEISSRVEQALTRYHLQELRLCDPSQLSGGQKKKLALAAVMTMQPQLIILDEPLSGLDQEGRELVTQLLDELKGQAKSVLVIEHDLDAPDACGADRWLILDQGHIVAYDQPARLRQGRLLYDLELLYDD